MANLTSQYQVTQEQIDAASRIIDNTHKQVFYLVQSASDANVEYKVSYNRQYHVLQCSCPAIGNCWHKNAVIAAEAEYQTEVRINRDADLAEAMETRSAEEISEQAQIESYVRQGIDRATAERVTYAPNAAKREDQPKGGLGYFHTTGFSLLK